MMSKHLRAQPPRSDLTGTSIVNCIFEQGTTNLRRDCYERARDWLRAASGERRVHEN
ncbi:hypothetical protein DPMN_115736 [Dreissena polymorpha]|uniref:Uncharacterized protein n=1 Tax=Dreissena polymorpha TaxID=45954 RepID=A0A9D4KML1_DREPO|nr:hypothetical protein DPMN_115736 [Dreissena polymorpha]